MDSNPCKWWSRINGYLLSTILTKNEANLNLYYIIVKSVLLILALYINNLFFISVEKLIGRYKAYMSTWFEMKDISMMHYFLGLKV